MISFISETLKTNYINEKTLSLLTQSNIIAGRVAEYMDEIDDIYVYEIVEDIVNNLSLNINSRVLIIGENKEILVDSYDTFEGSVLNNKEINQALNGNSVSNLYVSENFGRLIYVSVPITYKGETIGAVLISSSLEDIYSNIDETLKGFVLLSLFSLIITGIISFTFADILATPIENLTEIVKKTAQGKFNQKVEVKGNDELSNLGRAFNIMTTKLEQVDKQRSEFVANVSHELRTPLAAIKILSESLLIQNETDIKVYRDFLKDIDSEVDRLNKLIESLLQLVDLEKEQLDLDYQLSYVNYLIDKVINVLKPLADKKNIKIDFIQREKVQILLDQSKIQQALINIIGNAIKYTQEGGEVDIELYTENREVVIKVKDNGIGIPKDDMEHIFDRFYRVDKARSRETGGTGLGLPIAKQIILLHQGRIEIESEVGKGTTVYVYLPAEGII